MEPPPAVGVGPDRVGEPPRVPAVLLGIRGREPIPKAIQLLGVDGKDLNAAIEQAVHNRSVGDFNGDGQTPGVPARTRNHPVQKRAEPRTGRRNG